jgi:hypothetical protein
VTRPSDHPVRAPLFTGVLFEAISDEYEAAGIKAKAADTMFRHSDAGKCSRALAYDALGVPRSDPMDLAGQWVTWLGSRLHEYVQDALMLKYPGLVECEVKVQHEDLTSGHIDAVIQHPELGKVAYELKTKGSYGFDKAVGLRRKSWKQESPEGPGMGAKIQGALNASAIDADWLVIGVIGLEAVSKGMADKIGFNDYDRICAEWHYPRSEFGPWAAAELDRLRLVAVTVAAEMLPQRTYVGDEGQLVVLDRPSADTYPCSYCSHLGNCTQSYYGESV